MKISAPNEKIHQKGQLIVLRFPCLEIENVAYVSTLVHCERAEEVASISTDHGLHCP